MNPPLTCTTEDQRPACRPSPQRRWSRGRWALSALLVLTTGCAQPQSEPVKPEPSPAIQLSAQPGHLVFSGTRDAGSSLVQTVTLKNSSGAAVQLTDVTFSMGAYFGLVSPPTFPRTLAAGASLNLNVRLLPGNPTGVLRATLSAVGNVAPDGTVELSGLRAAGLEGPNEPTLDQIVKALDYQVNVGGDSLTLGTGAGLIGDEVAAQLFERASAAPVTLRPVARYSPDGPSAYGSFVMDGNAARVQVLGTMATGSHQSLNPPLQPGSRLTFEPGSQPFGIYLAASSYAAQNTYTLDSLNTAQTRHAVRTYPLKDRAGKVVPNSYLLGFEPSENGDYQDAVFLLENVRPVAAK